MARPYCDTPFVGDVEVVFPQCQVCLATRKSFLVEENDENNTNYVEELNQNNHSKNLLNYSVTISFIFFQFHHVCSRIEVLINK
jgi:hypothetical protein